MLIGRSAELAEVAERIWSGRPMAILGEAGVGKTALIREAARATGRPALEGGALASLSWMPYLPVERALGRAVPEGDRATVASYVAKRIEGGVLILDDLHWADPDTLALLELLAGRVALASAVRPDDPGTPPALQAARAALIEVLQLGELPASVRRVLEAARGNPFLLEELADFGRALGARPSHSSSIMIVPTPVPSTITALVVSSWPARLHRMASVGRSDS